MKVAATGPFIATVAASSFLHAAVLQWSPQASPDDTRVAVARLMPVHTRVVTEAATKPAAPPVEQVAEAPAAPPPPPRTSEWKAPAPDAKPEPEPAATPASAVVAQAASEPASQADAQTPVPADSGASSPWRPEDFVTGALLDQVPLLITNIKADLPRNAPPITGHHRVLVTLLIDTEGRVVDVTTKADDSVPPLYMEIAGKAFAIARFSPGLIAHEPVRSRVTLEVRFDEEPPRRRPRR